MSAGRPYYVWDYNISERQFLDILAGKTSLGALNRDWAAVRLLEYASYKDIVTLLGFREIIKNWQHWKNKIKSVARKRGLDFVVEWLPKHHPELI